MRFNHNLNIPYPDCFLVKIFFIPFNIVSSHKFYHSILPKTCRIILEAASHTHPLVDPFSTFVHFHQRISTTAYKKKKKETNRKYVINILIYLSLVFYRYSKLNLYRNLREVCISIFPSSLSRRCTTIQEHATQEEGGKKKKKKKDKKTWPLVSHANNAN